MVKEYAQMIPILLGFTLKHITSKAARTTIVTYLANKNCSHKSTLAVDAYKPKTLQQRINNSSIIPTVTQQAQFDDKENIPQIV
eukprot:Pgem_evm1s9814